MNSPKLWLGLTLLILVVAAGIASVWIIRWMFPDQSPTSLAEYSKYLSLTREHPLGTDPVGRDAFAVLLNGIRLSLVIGTVAGLVSTAIGVTVGFTAGYLAGGMDTILRILTDMFLVFPTLPLLLTLALYIPRWNHLSMGLLLGAFGWPAVARTVRAQVLSLRERLFVDLARLSGESTLEIIFLELVPQLLPYIFLSMSGSIVGAMLTEAGLQLIGVGAGGPPTLGYMIGYGYRAGLLSMGLHLQVLVPAFVLVLTFLALNLVNMGLEERFNPRLRTVAKEL